MLQGEMEQLTISKDSSAVSKQCSATRIPISTNNSKMYEMQGDDPNALTGYPTETDRFLQRKFDIEGKGKFYKDYISQFPMIFQLY